MDSSALVALSRSALMHVLITWDGNNPWQCPLDGGGAHFAVGGMVNGGGVECGSVAVWQCGSASLSSSSGGCWLGNAMEGMCGVPI